MRMSRVRLLSPAPATTSGERRPRCQPAGWSTGAVGRAKISAMEVMEWLLDGDPAIRWQVLRDLAHAPAESVAAERARVEREGWGARLLALRDPDGQWAGGPASMTSWRRLKPSEAARSRIRSKHPKPYVGCFIPGHPGSRKRCASGPSIIGKRWPQICFDRVGMLFSPEVHPTPRSRKKLVAGVRSDGGGLSDAAGKYSIDEMAALLEASRGVVSVNTGIMHLAAALDAPIVALHGPTNPLGGDH